MKLNGKKLLLDVTTFTTLLVSMNPEVTGMTVHEWLGIALAGGIGVHLLTNWKWIVEMTKRIFTPVAKGKRLNYALNWAMFLDGLMIMFSGLMISESVAPTFGLFLSGGHLWKEAHEVFTNAFLALLSGHIFLHWKWIVTTVKRMLPQSALRTPSLPLDMQKS